MLLNDRNALEYWGCDQPKCPHCDKALDISRHELYSLYAEGEHEVYCPFCDKEFVVSTRVSYSFSTDEQPECFAVSAGEKP